MTGPKKPEPPKKPAAPPAKPEPEPKGPSKKDLIEARRLLVALRDDPPGTFNASETATTILNLLGGEENSK